MSDLALLNDPPAIVGLQASQLEAMRLVNSYEAKIVAHDEASDTLRWEQAKEIAGLLESGMSQRMVAESWKRQNGTSYSEKHVRLVKKCWEEFADLGPQRPEWNDAYHSPEVRGAPEPKQPEVVLVADLAEVSDEDLRRLAWSAATFDLLRPEQKKELIHLHAAAEGIDLKGKKNRTARTKAGTSEPKPMTWTTYCPCPQTHQPTCEVGK